MQRADGACILRCGALNGECPVWSDVESKLYWVDVKGPALHCFDPAYATDVAWELPAWIGSCALDDRNVILALRTGLYRFVCSSGGLEMLAPPPYDVRRFTFNDGRCDRAGHFLVGPMYSPLAPGDQCDEQAQDAPVWRFGADRRWRAVTPPVRIANGLAFSPDGRRMYHSDTSRKTIWVCDYDSNSGDIEHHRVFAKVDDGGEHGGADGATVDRDGFYICAVFGAGVLLRFDPDGRLERRIEMPARYVTMPGFGDSDKATIYITSAAFPLSSDERRERPNEGALFALEAPVPGLSTPAFSPGPSNS
jgi:sugar lactone lactonase YvrE